MLRKYDRLDGVDLASLPRGAHSDGQGLELKVQPSGSRSWIQRVTIKGGKRTEMGLGGFPLTALKVARAKALENRRKAREGIDPRPPRIPTFDAVRKLWEAEREKQSWTERGKYQRRFDGLVLPAMGNLPVNRVDATAIRNVTKRAKSVSAAKAAVREIGSILDFAVAHGYCAQNPAPAIQRTIKRAKIEHCKYLEPGELRNTIPLIRESDAPLTIRVLLPFLYLVPLRVNEVRLAKWGEFDLEDWIVPAERMKSRRAFFLTIPKQAYSLISWLSAESNYWEIEDYVFAFPKGQPPHVSTLRYWRIKLGIDTDLHGIRSSFLVWCAEEGIDVKLGERCLSHVVDGQVTQAYLRTDFAKERGEVLQRWADWLTVVY